MQRKSTIRSPSVERDQKSRSLNLRTSSSLHRRQLQQGD
jgi:hypothetical protein